MQVIIQTIHPTKNPLGVRVVLFLMVASWLVSPLFAQQPEPDPTPTILFVCEHGAAKSVMAAAYFDQLAKEQGLKYKAVFRGTHPDPALAAAAEKGLRADGFDTSGWNPVLVSPTDMTQASRIIALGCALPESDRVKTKLTDWNNLPSPSQDYAAARDEIKRRIQQLVAELATTTKPKMMNAKGTFAVKLTPQDDKTEDLLRGRLLISKQFQGDLTGAGVGQMLTGLTSSKDSAGYVAIERVTGTLHGRKGSFLLQHSGTMTRGASQLFITVVPDSGREQLQGLAGQMKIRIEGSQHYYEFDYTLPPNP